MNKNTSFSLGEHFNHFVELQVGQGRYSSASDVVRAGLRLLEEREANLSALRQHLEHAVLQKGSHTDDDLATMLAADGYRG